MSKAEDRALEAFPLNIDGDSRGSYDLNVVKRIIYQQGYEQAEKDLEFSWKDIRDLYIIFAEVDVEIELCKTDNIKSETIGYYQEVLKRFKDLKEKKKISI